MLKFANNAALTFFALLILVNLPNFLWLPVAETNLLSTAEFIERLLIGLLSGSLLLCVFAKPARALLLLWCVCLWWLPLSLGVRIITAAPINATVIGMAAATSPAELQNLLTALSLHWLLFFVLWNVALYCLWCYLKKQPIHWDWALRGKVLLFSAAILALPHAIDWLRGEDALAGEVSAVVERKDSSDNTPANSLARGDSKAYLSHLREADQPYAGLWRLAGAFPYELPLAVAQYFQARKLVERIRGELPPPADLLQTDEARADIVVLVIGESSTRNAWHWFNAQAPNTTPKLEQRAAAGDALFGYGNTLAQTGSTRQAVPSILTAQPLVWPDGEPNPQATRSIVWLAAQAGYATGWFSNQAAVGLHDGIIASYTEEADAVAFLNPASFTNQGSLDEVLLPALKRHLQLHPKAFVVLHTMGSHFDYQHRYPAGFGVFPGANSAREHYFNSVAYTDWLLDQLMNTLAADGRKAALVYASDHGETLPDNHCQRDVPNRTTRDAYEVPALVWLSSSYAAAFPEIASQLRAQQSQHYDISAVYNTLLDVIRADVSVPLSPPSRQSFARRSTVADVTGQETLPVWSQKFQAAVEKNPCLVVLK